MATSITTSLSWTGCSPQRKPEIPLPLPLFGMALQAEHVAPRTPGCCNGAEPGCLSQTITPKRLHGIAEVAIVKQQAHLRNN